MSSESDVPSPVTTGSTKQPKTGRKWSMWQLVVVIVIVLVAIWLAYLFVKQMSGPKLETYSSGNYELLVPVGYEREEEGFTTNIVERDDDGTITSGVLVFAQAFPQAADDDMVEDGLEQLKEQAETIISSTLDDKYTFEEVTVTEDKTAEGNTAYRFQANLVRSGQQVATVKSLLAMTDKQTYVVSVVGGSGVLSDKADEILDSFKTTN